MAARIRRARMITTDGKIEPQPLRAPMYWGYTRVSTEKQRDNGTSLDTQKAKIETKYQHEFKETHAFGGILEDAAVSGTISLFERPQGQRLIKDTIPGDVVVIASMDRGFRNMFDCIESIKKLWKEKQVAVICLDMFGMQFKVSSAMEELLLNFIASIAEYTRKMQIERMTAGMHARVKRDGGVWWRKSPPYGYRRAMKGSKNFVPCEEQREYTRAIIKLTEEFPNDALGSLRFRMLMRSRGLYWYSTKDMRAMVYGQPKRRTHLPDHKSIAGWIKKEKKIQEMEAKGYKYTRKATFVLIDKRQTVAADNAATPGGIEDVNRSEDIQRDYHDDQKDSGSQRGHSSIPFAANC